jgi:hypothetical protein
MVSAAGAYVHVPTYKVACIIYKFDVNITLQIAKFSSLMFHR